MLAAAGRLPAVSAAARLPAMRELLASVPLFERRGLDMAERAGAAAIVAAAAPVAGWALSGSWVGGAACALAALALAARKARKAKSACEERLEAAMPDVFRMLATALGSGSSLPQAIRYVGEHAEEPVGAVFSRAAFSMDCGMPVGLVLDDVLRELGAPGLDLVVAALKISQRTGAPLKDLLADASEVVVERIELRRALDVKTAQARLSAQVVALMPLAMIGFLALVSADFQRGVATPIGMASVAVALGLDAIAWLVIRKIMAVEL